MQGERAPEQSMIDDVCILFMFLKETFWQEGALTLVIS
jgi:hypothetical protein